MSDKFKKPEPPPPVPTDDMGIPVEVTLPTFDIACGEKSGRVRARDSIEAWAVFCDQNKLSGASPRTGTANGKRIGFEADEAKKK